MFGLFAYSSAAAGINAALAQLNAVADQSLAPVGNNYVVPGSVAGQPSIDKLLGFLAVGATLTGSELQSPSLRELFFPDLTPLDVSATPTTPSKWVDLQNDLIQLASGEQLQAMITNTASDRESLLIALTDGAFQPASGEIQTVKATGSTTLVAGAWTNVAITLSQTLPAGQYQVCGLRYEGTSAIAARILFPGGYWRPGCPGCTGKGDLQNSKFRRGGYGVWGQFSTTVLPTIDCLANAADTAETFFLDLVKVSNTP